MAKHEHALALTEHWLRDGFPSSRDFLAVSGTRSWGPDLVITVVYRHVGRSWLWAKLAFALGSALGPVSIYILARGLTTNPRVWWTAFLATGLWPPAAFWSAIGVKDGFVGGLTFAALALALRYPGFGGSVAVALASAGLFIFRPIVAGAMVIALAAAALLAKPHGHPERDFRRVVAGLCASILAVAILFPRVTLLIGSASSLTAEIGGMEASILAGGLGGKAALLARPEVVVHGLVSPIPWLWDTESASPLRWLFPSFAIWIALLPLAVLGAIRVGRIRTRSAVLVMAFAAAYLGPYFLFFSGDFTRQRTMVEPLGLLLASVIVGETPCTALRVTAAWVATVGLLAFGHVLMVSS